MPINILQLFLPLLGTLFVLSGRKVSQKKIWEMCNVPADLALKAYLITSTSWQLPKIKIIFIKTHNRRKLVKRNELEQACMQYSLLIIIYVIMLINLISVKLVEEEE